MSFDKIFESLQREWAVIKESPILFITALLVGYLAIYSGFQANIDRKNDLTKTLQDQLQSRTTEAHPYAASLSTPPPSFRLLLRGGDIFIPDALPNLTGIALDVIVTNNGKPSLALDWKLSVIPKNGKPKLAQLTKMPTSLVARGQYSTAHISSVESLDESTLSSPLETDIPRAGKLLFYVDMPKSEVVGSVLELSVTDTSGHPFMVRQDLNAWLRR